jgi:hypothetical protein
MHTTIVVFILSIAVIAACDTGGSSRQRPSTTRDLAPTVATGCESLEGKVRDDCIRKTRKGKTATPARAGA